MKPLKNYFFESKAPVLDEESGILTTEQLINLIGQDRYDIIIKHKWFKEHFVGSHLNIAFIFRRKHGQEEVDLAHSPFGPNLVRKMIKIQFSKTGRKIINIHLYTNKNNEKQADGKLFWKHVKSLHDIEI